MMLCKADFDELFPDIFSPTKVDPAQFGKHVGRSDSALSTWQEPGPVRAQAIDPSPRLTTAPVQGEGMIKEPACPPNRWHA